MMSHAAGRAFDYFPNHPDTSITPPNSLTVASDPREQQLSNNADESSSNFSPNGLSSEEIVGVVIGASGTCILALTLAMVWCCRCRRRSFGSESSSVVNCRKPSSNDISMSSLFEHEICSNGNLEEQLKTQATTSFCNSVYRIEKRLHEKIEEPNAKICEPSFLEQPGAYDLTNRKPANMTHPFIHCKEDNDDGFHNPCYTIDKDLFSATTSSTEPKTADQQRYSLPVDVSKTNFNAFRRSCHLDRRVLSAIAAQRNQETSVFTCKSLVATNSKNDDIIIICGQRTAL